MMYTLNIIVCYHNGRYHTIEHDKGEKQREVAFAVVIIFAEEVEIKHEAQYEDADIQNLPCQHQLFLADGLAALDGLFAQAFEDIVGLPAHYLAASMIFCRSVQCRLPMNSCRGFLPWRSLSAGHRR